MSFWTYIGIYFAGGFLAAVAMMWQSLNQIKHSNGMIDAQRVALSILIWPLYVLAYVAFGVVVLVDKILGGE